MMLLTNVKKLMLGLLGFTVSIFLCILWFYYLITFEVEGVVVAFNLWLLLGVCGHLKSWDSKFKWWFFLYNSESLSFFIVSLVLALSVSGTLLAFYVTITDFFTSLII